MNLSRIRVRAGYTAGAIALFFARPDLHSFEQGVLLVIAGEIIRLWASGHIEKTLRLATGGPYAHTRNPLYVGSVVMALGLLWIANHPASGLAGVLYLAVFYPVIIREEAKFLRERFKDEYRAWAASVPLFLPRLTPAGPRASRFSLDRVKANHEWRTVLGLAVLCGLIFFRVR